MKSGGISACICYMKKNQWRRENKQSDGSGGASNGALRSRARGGAHHATAPKSIAPIEKLSCDGKWQSGSAARAAWRTCVWRNRQADGRESEMARIMA